MTTKPRNIRLDPGGKRVTLQETPTTEQQVADLIKWGYDVNLTGIVRHAIREAWERQRTIHAD